MTRYRLPAELGGMELPEDTGGVLDVLIGVHRARAEAWMLRFDIPGVGRIRVQREALEEVKPPLPPEPPLMSLVQVGVDFYHRRSKTGIDWFKVGSDNTWETWQRLCDRVVYPETPVVYMRAAQQEVNT